jgi:hypothetical protein
MRPKQRKRVTRATHRSVVSRFVNRTCFFFSRRRNLGVSSSNGQSANGRWGPVQCVHACIPQRVGQHAESNSNADLSSSEQEAELFWNMHPCPGSIGALKIKLGVAMCGRTWAVTGLERAVRRAWQQQQPAPAAVHIYTVARHSTVPYTTPLEQECTILP